MILYYENSKKEKIDFTKKPYMMLSTTNLFDSEWDDVVIGQTIKRTIGFVKAIGTAEITIRVTGSDEKEMRENLERLIQITDYDTATANPGKIYVGNYSLECFVKANKKDKIFCRSYMQITLSLKAENGFWKSNQLLKYKGIGLVHNQEIASSVIPITSEAKSKRLIYNSNEDGTAEIKWASGFYGSGRFFGFDFGESVGIDSISGIVIESSGSGAGTGALSFQISTDGESWETIETHASMSLGETYEFKKTINERFRYFRIINTTDGYWTIGSESASITVQAAEQSSSLLLWLGYELKGMSIEISDEEEIIPSFDVKVDGEGILEFNAENVVVDFATMTAQDEKVGEIQGLVDGEWKKIVDIDGEVSFIGSFSCDKVRAVFTKSCYIENFWLSGITAPQLANNNYVPSDAIIKISGLINEPSIIIGDNQYGADVQIASGKYLEINTEEKTLRLYDSDGTFENVYASNTGGFEQIPEGTSLIDWNGNQTIEINLIQKRGDPRWD